MSLDSGLLTSSSPLITMTRRFPGSIPKSLYAFMDQIADTRPLFISSTPGPWSSFPSRYSFMEPMGHTVS